MAKPVCIYSPFSSNRLNYVLNQLFKELLGIEYTLVKEKSHTIHINYSSEAVDGALQIVPYPLLSEKGIKTEHKSNVAINPWASSWGFYKTSDTELPYDIFSASFFLLSRYEEYLEFFLDEHYRFTARESVLSQFDVLDQPLINQWALILKDLLEERFEDLQFQPRKFEFISTIDIDQAWKYRHKGIKRNAAGFIRDFIEGKWENFKERIPVLLRFKKDPFFNFDWQLEFHNKHKIALRYFVLLADYDEYDKNIDWRNIWFRKALKNLDEVSNNQLGIHPSYASNTESEDLPNGINLKLDAEIKRLETIIERDITLSRQHFLMHKFPDTYQQLLCLGIQEEHSMGYSTHIGFRAGIAAPFYFYDLKNDLVTEMKLMPFCLMDITPLYYMGKSPTEAIELMKELMDRVKSVDGMFISLWHNESLAETERWKGWRILYEEMCKYSNA